jgi:small subunit ribosomal protein S2
MLVERTDYLSAGVHIGMKSCTKYLKQFVYKIRDDGLAVFNLRKVDARIIAAAAFLSRFKNILIVSRKTNAAEALKKFAEVIGCKHISGRFSPGTLTNPSYRDFFEPDVIVIIDPLVDEQAIREAKKKRIPVVTLCDTFNEASDLDLIIPANNNGKKAIALILLLLAREILKNRGKIKKDSDFKYTIEDFGAESGPQATQNENVQQPRPAPGKKPDSKAKSKKTGR